MIREPLHAFREGAGFLHDACGLVKLLSAIKPRAPDVENLTAEFLPSVSYQKSSYAFVFAPIIHPGMRNLAPFRKDLGFRTIFNLLGPLVNPVECR